MAGYGLRGGGGELTLDSATWNRTDQKLQKGSIGAGNLSSVVHSALRSLPRSRPAVSVHSTVLLERHNLMKGGQECFR